MAQLKKEKKKNAMLMARVSDLEAAALKDAQTKEKYVRMAQHMLGDVCPVMSLSRVCSVGTDV